MGRPSVAGSEQSASSRPSVSTEFLALGLVTYDFEAVHSNEINVSKGEYIKIVAKSTNEWYVAKPISREGHYGLVPANRLVLHDPRVGLPVHDMPIQQQEEFINHIPDAQTWRQKKEEQRKRTVDLGRVTSNVSNPSMRSGQPQRSRANSQASNTNSLRHHSTGSSHRPSVARHGSTAGSNLPRPSWSVFERDTLYPVTASVPLFGHDKASGTINFVGHAQLSDGTCWTLFRPYADFARLQEQLDLTYEYAAGRVPGYSRTLPEIPQQVPVFNDKDASRCRRKLDQYVKDLIKMPANISQSRFVREFFLPRDTDKHMSREVMENTARELEILRIRRAQRTYSDASLHDSTGRRMSDRGLSFSTQPTIPETQSTAQPPERRRPSASKPQSFHPTSPIGHHEPPETYEPSYQPTVGMQSTKYQAPHWSDHDSTNYEDPPMSHQRAELESDGSGYESSYAQYQANQARRPSLPRSKLEANPINYEVDHRELYGSAHDAHRSSYDSLQHRVQSMSIEEEESPFGTRKGMQEARYALGETNSETSARYPRSHSSNSSKSHTSSTGSNNSIFSCYATPAIPKTELRVKINYNDEWRVLILPDRENVLYYSLCDSLKRRLDIPDEQEIDVYVKMNKHPRENKSKLRPMKGQAELDNAIEQGYNKIVVQVRLQGQHHHHNHHHHHHGHHHHHSSH